MKRLMFALPVVALIATSAFARGPGGPGGPGACEGHHPPPPHVVIEQNAEELGIDEATVAEITAIAEGARPRFDALHEEMKSFHDSLRALRDEGGSFADQDAIEDDMGALRDELTTLRRSVRDQIHALLTPEQTRAMQELRPEPPEGRGRPGEGRRKGR